MNSRTIIILLVLAAAVLLAAMLQRGRRPVRRQEASPSTVTLANENPATRVSPFARSSTPATPRRHRTNTTTTTAELHAALTGFIVDDFRNWASIPPGYHLDGLQLRDGALALADSSTSAPRNGSLVSPALELWQPALSAPTDASAPVPEGCSIQSQISLSEDGRTWSDFLTIERRVTPDGHQASPQGPPSWSGTKPRSADGATSGPFIRYRLTLTSQNSATPLVQDVRIWRNSRI